MKKYTQNQKIYESIEESIKKSQLLTGIGNGHNASNSGEKILFKILEEKKKVNEKIIFDIGANKGQFLNLAFENLCIDDYRIHCFEPSEEAFRILTDNAIISNRVIFNNMAISSKIGKSRLYASQPGSVLASLSKRRLDHFDIDFNYSEEVVTETIDNYCLKNKISEIDLLKIDVEGHELDVLKGAENLINNRKINIISFEFGGCNIDTRTYFQDFWYYFKEKKYTLYRIMPNEDIFEIDEYSEYLEQFTTQNFLAELKGERN